MIAIHTPTHLLVNPYSVELCQSGKRYSTTATVSFTSTVAIMCRICVFGTIVLLVAFTYGVANDSASRTTVKTCDNANWEP